MNNNQPIGVLDSGRGRIPLVEEKMFNHQITKIIAKEYLQPLLKKRIDTLVLACTHYPLLKRAIKKTVGKQVVLISPGKMTAKSLVKKFKNRKLSSYQKRGDIKLYFTDSDLPNTKEVEKYLGKKIYSSKIRQVSLDKI